MADGGKGERRRETEGGFKPAIQNFGRFFATGVMPKSAVGRTGAATGSVQLAPGYYSLGVETNVPFVILKGPTRMQKTLSWGETIAIPEGFAATLFNDSFHPGDIVLKGGQDWPTVPRRITVPVDFTVADADTSWLITPQWPVDTRRARQAWLVWNATISAQVVVPVQGRREEGSHYTNPNTNAPGYDENITMPAGSFRYVPLGYASAPPAPVTTFASLLPMALLDWARVLAFPVLKADVAAPAQLPMYYVLEY